MVTIILYTICSKTRESELGFSFGWLVAYIAFGVIIHKYLYIYNITSTQVLMVSSPSSSQK